MTCGVCTHVFSRLFAGSQYYYVGLRNNVHYSPSSLYGVNCVGDEDMLLNCVYSRLSSSQLLRPPYSIAAVLCQGSATQSNNPNECISGEVRLANSSNNIEGRVEICTERMWVSVCDRYWGMKETRAFCKQLLGHPAKGIVYPYIQVDRNTQLKSPKYCYLWGEVAEGIVPFI